MMSPSSLRSLKGQVVAIRADASIDIGSGHVMRCLTLADALREEGADCHFLCRIHEGHLCKVIEDRGYPVHRLHADDATRFPREFDASQAVRRPLPVHSDWLGVSQAEDAAACCHILAGLAPSWLVVDHYALDSRWEASILTQLEPAGTRLLVIDDLADRHHHADLLLDQNFGRRELDYRPLVPERCRALVGSHFALLRPEFFHWRTVSLARRAQQHNLSRILISLGGVDKNNVSERVLEAMKACDLPEDLEITVVMGAAAPWLESVKSKAAELPWSVEVVVNINDMARRMAEADLAVGAAGSTSWERCCLGLPTLMLVLAENQQDIARILQNHGAALSLDLADMPGSLVEHIATLRSRANLKIMSKRASELVDGRGTSRVLAELKMLDQVEAR